ncbi:MAG: hypothetical protein K8J31_26310 [Anaerolineae bacterium]|nr:hypothetical protein [Anaerolineae bacterium]
MEAQPDPDTPAPRRHPLRRPGCILGLILWFLILLTPCFMIVLAVQGEIAVTTGSAPDQRLRVWLIQEAAQSGIGVSSASVQTQDDLLCVQTDVRFVLWRGSAEPTQYCECYTGTDANWQTVRVEQSACSLP